MYRALVIICLLVPMLSNAQYDSKGDIRSRFRPGGIWYLTGLRPAQPEKVRKYDRLIFDITYNDWVGDQDPFQNKWSSIGLNTNFMFDIPMTKGNTVSFGIGAAHELKIIRHDNNLSGDDMSGSTSYFLKDSLDVFDKSKFGTNSFSIPIEFRFRKESWRHFKFHIGGRIGYQINAYSKQITNTDDGRLVNKRVGFPDENKLIYGAHLRIGLRNLALYGAYYINPLFSNSSSVQLNHLQFGLSVSLF